MPTLPRRSGMAELERFHLPAATKGAASNWTSAGGSPHCRWALVALRLQTAGSNAGSIVNFEVAAAKEQKPFRRSGQGLSVLGCQDNIGRAFRSAERALQQ